MVIKPLHEEAELLAKIAEGDQLAFKVIYDQYHRQVYNFAFKWIQEKESAQEIVQETMLYLWQLGHKLKDIHNLEAYLKTIAKRKAIDVFRTKVLQEKSVRVLATAYIDGHNDTEEGILMREARNILAEGISQLPAQQQQVYRLCQQQGLKYEEAARQLGISHGTVQTHMKLALKFLRTHVLKNTDVAALLVILKLF
ncbi:RNA polymerase sigma factor [Pedobacter africanus]|uniref:RNA polymerase sigma-70 factor, ECF subfamily n=1 Tax=Pedobacter africanus TaxID=151894 RepID=A0A1W2D9P2_9SPHI|nr:RNA polymerase sigma-70 factor [Pedobacter africanus]SMC94161.1 RNA polymerase sigma-70 factor, ECF subfamily [Pedobacter africanus]